MADSVRVRAWAKLNYTLDVLSARPDGYHNLASIMQTISLADTVMVSRAPGTAIELRCDSPDVPADARNLAFRAAENLRAATGRHDGLRIDLAKEIPVQAGLGGGSSDAAAVLRATARLLQLDLPPDRIAALASELGSDVPFFLTGGSAAVRGRGETVVPLPDGPPLWFVVVKPEESIATGPAYAALDAIPNRVSARATRAMQDHLAGGDQNRVASSMTNDFEQVVFERHLGIALVMDDLLMARARSAHLCGSGSAVFGVALSEQEAQQVARLVRLRHQRVVVCRTVGRDEALATEEASDGRS